MSVLGQRGKKQRLTPASALAAAEGSDLSTI